MRTFTLWVGWDRHAAAANFSDVHGEELYNHSDAPVPLRSVNVAAAPSAATVCPAPRYSGATGAGRAARADAATRADAARIELHGTCQSYCRVGNGRIEVSDADGVPLGGRAVRADAACASNISPRRRRATRTMGTRPCAKAARAGSRTREMPARGGVAASRQWPLNSYP